jgi:hypothetical protein
LAEIIIYIDGRNSKRHSLPPEVRQPACHGAGLDKQVIRIIEIEIINDFDQEQRDRPFMAFRLLSEKRHITFLFIFLVAFCVYSNRLHPRVETKQLLINSGRRAKLGL